MELIKLALRFPKATLGIAFLLAIIAGFQFHKIRIDTDPENMLSKEEFVRRFNDEVKKEFSIYDFIVLGIVNDKSSNGVFNPVGLRKIYNISKEIENIEGVISHEIISLTTKDNIRQGALGEVIFEWLMKEPPKTQEEALHIRDEAKDNPLFDNVIVSEDGKAIAILIPIKAKSLSYRISQQIKKIVKKYKGDEKYYITGLPVAEDTFGVEMFKQMTISAPLAGLIVFLLMLLFFRKFQLVISPMIVAVLTVITTMGLLIGTGNIVHIMSSMIPIFLMPIAVLDSIHILSEFHLSYMRLKDRKKAVLHTMETLFMPMLYTSLTTTAGFASLALTPIPPVQVFGMFVAFGVMYAWILTVTFVPAWIVLMKEESIVSLGAKEDSGITVRFCRLIGRMVSARWKLVIEVTMVVIVGSIVGITKIVVNDNPTKWFVQKHPIRVADKVLNSHFGGTYPAYIIIEGSKENVFKEPELLRYIERLQEYLGERGVVGKSLSLGDIVKKIYYELMGGDKSYNKIPSSSRAVAQCLISFQNSHKPDDLWHFVTPDYKKINLWLQLKSGDNKDMKKVVDLVEEFLSANPPPFPIEIHWAGITYINLVWQEKMVVGMLNSLLGSFTVVFLMMVFLFRSPLWGLLSMIPLSVTLCFIYGLIGWVGKDYDMPIAVLSSLTLGLSIDFAIHMLKRMDMIYKKCNNIAETIKMLFGEPAVAITKNAIVIGIAFLPLLLSPLVPYKTVGFFMFTIMFFSGVITLIVLPALIIALKKYLFVFKESVLCNCVNCMLTSSLITLGIAFVLYKFRIFALKPLIIVAIFLVIILMLICRYVSQRERCRVESIESSEI